MSIKAVLFDLDGVIVTTDDCHYQAWRHMADEEGIYFDRQINERLRGVSRMESLDILLERSPRVYSEVEKEALATRKNEHYKQLIHKLTAADILPGVMPILEELKHCGIKIAIASSSKNTPLILKGIGLSNYFDAVADGNDIKKSKPDPEVFLLAAQRVSTLPEYCLVVEDADAGVEGALVGGMKVLGVGAAAKNNKATLVADDLSAISVTNILSL